MHEVTGRSAALPLTDEFNLSHQDLLEALPAGAYVCDASGQIIYFNRQAETMWGRAPRLRDPADRFCGSLRLFAPDGSSLPHDACAMARALQTGTCPEGQEVVIERPDGTRVTALCKINLLRDQQQRVTGGVNVFVGVTERRPLEGTFEQACRQLELLREADRRKDEFLAILAHELRNPLAPICNSLHIMRLSDDLSPGVERVRAIMERQVNLMVRLVDDLLEISRITRGKIELRREIVDLAAVVCSAVETSRPIIEAARHQFAFTLPTEPVRLNADPARLAQVVGNLLNNAAKYTREGGQIWLSAREEEGMAVLSVRDTGVGIPQDMLPHIFDMFSQVDRNVNRAQGGLGIGLTLAKNLIEMHGGTISVSSEGPEKGSEFVVRLPIVACEEETRTAPAATALSNRTLSARHHRILVVDDTPSAAYILGKLLEKLGHQVSTSHDAAAALDVARLERPDVVISDIAMPHLSGYDLARRLRKEPGLEGTILVALTGFGQSDDRAKAIDAGFDFHLVKPVSLEALQETLGSIDALGASPVERLKQELSSRTLDLESSGR